MHGDKRLGTLKMRHRQDIFDIVLILKKNARNVYRFQLKHNAL